MTKNPPDISCPCISGKKDCGGPCHETSPVHGTPLTNTSGCEKFKICRISGDRKMCARMAQLGFLPGSEIELICPGKAKKPCMVRLKGATVTLNELLAEHIYVTPA